MRYFVLPLLLVCFATACTPERVEEKVIEIEKTIDADAEPGLIHTVYFWMTDDVDEAGMADFMDGIQELEAIPSVKRIFIGPPAATEARGVVNNSFDVALIVWFDDVAGHDEYQEHPIHLKFVEDYEAKFKEVRVHDNVLR